MIKKKFTYDYTVLQDCHLGATLTVAVNLVRVERGFLTEVSCPRL